MQLKDGVKKAPSMGDKASVKGGADSGGKGDKKHFSPLLPKAKARTHSVLLVLFLLLFAVGVVRLAAGGSVPTFTSLLEILSNSPTIPSDWITFVSGRFSSHIPFDWLASVVAFIEGILSVAAYLAVGMTNLIIFISYFMRWIFLA